MRPLRATHYPAHPRCIHVTPSHHNNPGRASPLAGVNTAGVISDAIVRAFGLTGSNLAFGHKVLDLAHRLFRGEVWSYQPINLRYHDFAHTLQATYCYLDLVTGQQADSAPRLAPREVELGLAAILLHDSGYLVTAGDTSGTGAKYTYCHEIRSCGLAASLLPPLGCRPDEVDMVVGAIRCTGINGNPSNVNFRSANARLVGCMIATADYLGQMAAPEYPEKLPYLFHEFAEADAFSNIPPERRTFSSPEAMLAATPTFWAKFVRPKLDEDFSSVYRFLCPAGQPEANPYFDAIERNIAVLLSRAAAAPVSPAPKN